MKLFKRIVTGVSVVTGILIAVPAAWAESQVGDPGAFGIAVDPNAAGTKVSGNVTLSYDYEFSFVTCPDSGRFVRNLYAVATMTKGNLTQPFNANYTTQGFPANLPACFDNQANQVLFLRMFIERVVVPGFFNCTPGTCPAYAVKSIKNFLTTGVGAGSMDVELAVK